MPETTIYSIRELIAKWPSAADFAAAIDAPRDSGRIFNRRNRIPHKYHPATVRACQARGLALTHAELLHLCRKARGEGY